MQWVKKVKVEVKLTGPDGDVQDKDEEGGLREAAEEHNKASGAGGKVAEAEEKPEGIKKVAGKDSVLERVCGSRSSSADIIGWTSSTGKQAGE